MKRIIAALFKTGTANIIQIISGVATSKIIAIVLGVSGLGIFGILKQILQFSLIFSSFNGQQGIVQGIASRHSNLQKHVYQTIALWLMMFLLIISILILLIWGDKISMFFFSELNTSALSLVKLLPIALIFHLSMYYCASLLNGYRLIGKLALMYIIGSLSAVIIAYPVAVIANKGYLNLLILILLINGLTSSIAGLFFLKRFGHLKLVFVPINHKVFTRYIKHFINFSLVTLASGLYLNGAILLLQSFITKSFGITEVGIFVAAWTISSRYLTILITSLGTYYMPTLSGLITEEEKTELIYTFQKLTVYIITPLIGLMTVFKDDIILLLYSKEFLSAATFLSFLLLGDYFKATSWTFGLNLLARANTKVFFIKEVSILTIFVILSYILTSKHGIQGVGISYIVMHLINLVFLFFYSKRKYNYLLKKEIIYQWLVGMLIVAISIFFIGDIDFFSVKILWLILIIVLIFSFLEKKYRIKILKIINIKF